MSYMDAKVFFDTNILVYAFDQSVTGKREQAQSLIGQFGGARRLVLSTQILQELYVTLCKKGVQPLTPAEAAEIVSDFAEYHVVQVDKGLIKAAMQRHRDDAFSFWDALVVEAALHSGCSVLFSEDMQNGQQIAGLTIRNPFV